LSSWLLYYSTECYVRDKVKNVFSVTTAVKMRNKP